MTTATARVRELPSELRGIWVHSATAPRDRERPRMPVGVLLNHGDHMMLVLWVHVEGAPEPAVVDSLTPLTIAHSLTCPTCGARGVIVNDRWEPC